jgi:hypothetical protein
VGEVRQHADRDRDPERQRECGDTDQQTAWEPMTHLRS